MHSLRAEALDVEPPRVAGGAATCARAPHVGRLDAIGSVTPSPLGCASGLSGAAAPERGASGARAERLSIYLRLAPDRLPRRARAAPKQRCPIGLPAQQGLQHRLRRHLFACMAGCHLTLGSRPSMLPCAPAGPRWTSTEPDVVADRHEGGPKELARVGRREASPYMFVEVRNRLGAVRSVVADAHRQETVIVRRLGRQMLRVCRRCGTTPRHASDADTDIGLLKHACHIGGGPRRRSSWHRGHPGLHLPPVGQPLPNSVRRGAARRLAACAPHWRSGGRAGASADRYQPPPQTVIRASATRPRLRPQHVEAKHRTSFVLGRTPDTTVSPPPFPFLSRRASRDRSRAGEPCE